ncbi:MAG TPA: hypothetical protein VLN49_09250 [Gemmatimonadaceae bacterium]|nr:hypothetical protein [Gemmatimonadaceae bacterium]
MLPHIAITRTWLEDDVAQLAFEVCDGGSVFTTEAYAARDWGAKAAADLRTFSGQVHGGLFNLRAGESGPEYAGGCFVARFHYYNPTELLISVKQQGTFRSFKRGEVASEARMFLRTEPALLDRFVAALPALDASDGGNAILECVPLRA